MKVIFLDIDGVLNSQDAMHEQYKDNGNRMVEMYFMCTNLVERLNYLTRETGAKLVISSTWRKSCDTLEELQEMTAKHGIIGEVIGSTGTLWIQWQYGGYGQRGQEIDQWLCLFGKKHNVESFIILDDDSDMYPYFNRFIRTENMTGLTCENVERAIKMLGN